MWDDTCVVQLLRNTGSTGGAAPSVSVVVEAMDDPSFPCSVATVALTPPTEGRVRAARPTLPLAHRLSWGAHTGDAGPGGADPGLTLRVQVPQVVNLRLNHGRGDVQVFDEVEGDVLVRTAHGDVNVHKIRCGRECVSAPTSSNQ